MAEQWLTTGQAAERLGVHADTVRRWVDDGLLRLRRTTGGHRRVTEGSVAALAAVLDMPPGAGRDAAEEELRQANRR